MRNLSTKTEKALEMMRQRKPFKEIRKKGPSPTYTAIITYFDEVEELYDRYRVDQPRMQTELNRLRNQSVNIKDQIDTQTRHSEALRKENKDLEENNKQLRTDRTEQDKQLKELIMQEKSLHDKGISPETIKRFSMIDFGTEDELITRITSSEAHQELMKSVDWFKGRKELHRNSAIELLDSRKELDQEVTEQKVALKKEQQKYIAFRQDLDQLARLRELNIAAGNLEALVEALLQHSTGEPETTITGLLESVVEFRTLQHIKRQIQTEESRLEETMSQLNEAEGKLDSITEYTVKNLEQARKKAVDTITGMEKRVTETLIRLNKDIEEWGDLREEAGKYAEYSRFGYLILGVLSDPNALAALRPHQVASIMERIHQWIIYSYGDTDTKPPDVIKTQLGMYADYPSYKLHLLSQWLTLELKRRVTP